MEWIEETNCVVCGSKAIQYHGFGIVPIIRFPEVLNNCPLAVLTTYSACECGLIFQNPHMDNEGIADFYKSGLYRQLVNVPSPEAMESDERNGQIAWADLVKPGKHLDIGCSHGLMLELTRAKGCDILGVEPNRDYVNFGIPSKATIYEVEGEWDTITCKHVLEHVTELTRFVDKIVELLKPGGTLYLEVPAEGAPGASARLPHLYMFTEAIVRNLFGKLAVEKYERKPHHFFVMKKEA